MLPTSTPSFFWRSPPQDQTPEEPRYELLKKEDLGRGCNAAVLPCRERDTGRILVMKTPFFADDSEENWEPTKPAEEGKMMERLRVLDPDDSCIVRYYDTVVMDKKTCLVFECLDISLLELMRQREGRPLPLHELRSIIQQMATALDALKMIDVIHGDIKMDNVLLVDQENEPFRIKLIDFGEALLRKDARPGDLKCCLAFRPPEILLGVPYTEAIDMWTLGCIVAEMFLGVELFPRDFSCDVLCYIVKLLGQPADHLLDAGVHTHNYFDSSPEGWSLKAPPSVEDESNYELSFLQDLTEESQEGAETAEVEERRSFLDLLRRMLRVDPGHRITPSEVLNHPFMVNSSQ
ncbi:homeodomain-interacting protein kinase 2-like [Diretmus argenteus]